MNNEYLNTYDTFNLEKTDKLFNFDAPFEIDDTFNLEKTDKLDNNSLQ
jgi:hypothetical protein